MSCQGMMGSVWPDGQAIIHQPVRLRSAFAMIGSVEAKCSKKGKQ